VIAREFCSPKLRVVMNSFATSRGSFAGSVDAVVFAFAIERRNGVRRDVMRRRGLPTPGG